MGASWFEVGMQLPLLQRRGSSEESVPLGSPSGDMFSSSSDQLKASCLWQSHGHVVEASHLEGKVRRLVKESE